MSAQPANKAGPSQFQLPLPQCPAYRCGAYGPWSLGLAPHPPPHSVGYYTGPGTQAAYHFLSKDGVTWMSTSLMERESHAYHVQQARGNVVVCGVGMGMYLYNLCRNDRVRRIVAVEIDADILAFLRAGTDFTRWPGAEKVTLLNRDALQLTAGDVGMSVDYLYVDIWPALGSAIAIPNTQTIHRAIGARRVGWWGQELDFVRTHLRQTPARPMSWGDLSQIDQTIGLPLPEPKPEYVAACQRAYAVYRYALEQAEARNKGG